MAEPTPDDKVARQLFIYTVGGAIAFITVVLIYVLR